LLGGPPPEQLTRLYSDFYPRSSLDISQYHPDTEPRGIGSWLNGKRCSACFWVPEGVRVLDIGCGFGESLGYHTARKCDVYGIETDENIRRVADHFGFKVHVGLFDPSLYEEDFFDYVTMNQVVEHVCDPHEALKGVARVLKPGGVAVVSTPNSNGWGAHLFGNRWINWHAPYHSQFFSLESMAMAARNAGLVLEESRTITSSEWLYYQWIHLLLRPVQGEPSIFWVLGQTKGFAVKVLLTLITLVHRTKINHLITRFFDAMGLGDNFLFILRKNA